MCPMCEKRAQLLLQQQTVVESSPTTSSKPSGNAQTGKSYLFRNPFKACKNLTHQCCSPLCESQRTSIASGRRSSVIAPSPTPLEHSGELTYRVSESPLSAESKDEETHPEPTVEPQLNPNPPVELRVKSRKRKGLLTRLKALTQGADPKELRAGDDPSSNESSFTACGRKVVAVADELEHGSLVREGALMPSVATLLAAETDLDSMSEVSIAVTETNVSETTIISMMNLNGSFSSPYEMTSYRGSTLKSSAYDDDASSFAIVPRTSMNSSFGQDGASDASGLSDRFGELDIGYLSLEESGEGPEFDDTVSISSDQHDDLDLDMHPQDDTVSESDLDQEYSISTDSQEWVTETEDTASILLRSRSHHNRTDNLLHQQSHTTPPPLQPSAQANQEALSSSKKEPLSVGKNPLFAKKDTTPEGPKKSDSSRVTPKTQSPETPATSTCTEYLCSRCGRKESKENKQQGQQEQPEPTTKNVTRKENPMSTYFRTYMDGEDQAVMAAKVVVLLGKYGNRKGLRVAGLRDAKGLNAMNDVRLTVNELDRLRSMTSPSSDAVSAFQNEVARMMLEGVDVPDLNMDVEQFIAGYMKLNSPFYIDLIEDFFKSVCIDCFGHMDQVTRQGRGSQRPAYTVLKPRKTLKNTSTGAVKNTSAGKQ
ncbi:hypothetical protein KC19_4G038000 [Ceratodon purpureus]|uniref:OVATE domain-containing protein n=1 Tax=Ceratodon purpureus TaxID=3225 RepID=A0A8T0I886_CERPU|nr:hypothetical protein KC19_4G038000 [Ceratodon purpureus]